jgi:hypothetical protein
MFTIYYFVLICFSCCASVWVFLWVNQKTMLCTDLILQIASYMKNPMPVLCCAKWLYKNKTNSIFFPLPCPLPPSCLSNYDFYKRKTLLQDVCFYCGDDLGDSSCLLLCTCIGFYPKLHYECVGVPIKYKVGYAVCPLCKTNCMYLVNQTQMVGRYHIVDCKATNGKKKYKVHTP